MCPVCRSCIQKPCAVTVRLTIHTLVHALTRFTRRTIMLTLLPPNTACNPFALHTQEFRNHELTETLLEDAGRLDGVVPPLCSAASPGLRHKQRRTNIQ